MDVRPGSMGRPLPGIEAAVARRDDDGDAVLAATAARARRVARTSEGELALRPGWPSMFRGYLDDEERYAQVLRRRLVPDRRPRARDADGYFWFVGRADDVIKSAGHLIGPFEVESALMEHPAVAEAGVIGKPDPVAGEIVKAFVALKPGYEPSEALRTRAARLRAQAARRGRRAAGDRLRREPAAHPQRQDHAPPAARPASSACPRATSRRWRRAP